MVRGGRGNGEWGSIKRKKMLSANKKLLRINHKNTISKGHFFVGHPVYKVNIFNLGRVMGPQAHEEMPCHVDDSLIDKYVPNM